LFEFNPSVKGIATWIDRRTVQFRPEKRMVSGQMYAAKFFLSKLINELPKELQTFEYSFQIIPQNFEVAIVNVRPVNKTQLDREVIEGNVNTADYAEGSEVEKSVSAV